MYSIKVIAHSASGKSVLASVSKKIGLFTSEIATGSIKVDTLEGLDVGTVMVLDAVTKVSTRTSFAEDNGKEFVWLVLE